MSRQVLRREAFQAEFQRLSQKHTMPRAIRRQIARDIVRRAWSKERPRTQEPVLVEPGNLIVPATGKTIIMKHRSLGASTSMHGRLRKDV